MGADPRAAGGAEQGGLEAATGEWTRLPAEETTELCLEKGAKSQCSGCCQCSVHNPV